MPPQPDPAPFDCVLRAWREHQAELRAFLVHRSANADMAEDLLQDVFIKSMRQGQGFCALDNPRAWLFQVARNALIDAARAQRPTEPLDEELRAPELEPRTPVDELDACVARNLPRLAPEDRDVLEACDLQGQTVRAYAEARGLSLAAAKSRLLRARQRLRDLLVSNCQVRFDDAGSVCCHTPPAG